MGLGPWLLAAAAVQGGSALGASFLKGKNRGGLSGADIEHLMRRKGELLRNREMEIGTFGKQLAASRSMYMEKLHNLNNLAFNRFVPQAETHFASRGMNPLGGAYQSTLAKRSADLQASGDLQEAQMGREDLMTVENMRQALASAELGSQFDVPMGKDIANPWAERLGILGGTIGNTMSSYAASNYFDKMMGGGRIPYKGTGSWGGPSMGPSQNNYGRVGSGSLDLSYNRY